MDYSIFLLAELFYLPRLILYNIRTLKIIMTFRFRYDSFAYVNQNKILYLKVICIAIMDVRINDVLGLVYMNLSVFSCLEMIRQLLELNLGIGKLKIGIFG